MRIKTIKIQGYKGIEDVEFNPGPVTILSKNGVNKSSIIDAIKALYSHEHQPGRIRTGSEYALVDVKMDNGHRYKMKTTAKSTNWDFKDDKGEPLTRTKEMLDSLVRNLSMDPMKLLNQNPQEQVRTYTQALPVRITAPELAVDTEFLRDISLNQHALDVIGDDEHGVYGNIYKKRTGLNREIKVLRNTISDLESSLGSVAPPEGYKTWSAKYDRIEKDLSELRVARAAMEAEITKAYDKSLDAARAYFDTVTAQALQQKNNDMAAVEAVFAPQFGEVKMEAGRAKQGAESELKLDGLKTHITHNKASADSKEKEAEKLTGHLERLKKLKTSLVESSPIPGLVTTPKGLELNGVAFGDLNLQKQIDIAIKIAQLDPGPFGLIVIDNLEHLDDGNYQLLLDALIAAADKDPNLQFVGAKVTNEDGGLHIETSDDPSRLPF